MNSAMKYLNLCPIMFDSMKNGVLFYPKNKSRKNQLTMSIQTFDSLAK
jgi:hypothetical protein